MQNKKAAYNAKYNRANTKQVKIHLNVKTDSDILEHLATVPNTAGYLKALIRNDINNK